jgi:PEP-CTERM motif
MCAEAGACYPGNACGAGNVQVGDRRGGQGRENVVSSIRLLILAHNEVVMRTRTLTWALAAILGLCVGPTSARASITLKATDSAASLSFAGTGSGATFGINNGFTITGTSGSSSSLLLPGTLGGTYSYTSITSSNLGLTQTANLTPTSGGLLTINDGHGGSFTASTTVMTGSKISTTGLGAYVLSGTLDLTLSNVKYTYSGNYSGNAGLKQLANGSTLDLSFTTLENKSLTQLSAKATDPPLVSPEPSSLAVAGIGALGMLGYGLRRRMARGA